MNFFAVGFILANLQLGLGLGAGYVIKLAGGLFMLGGIAELCCFDKQAERLRPWTAALMILSAAAAAAVFILGQESTAGNVCAAAGGILTTAAAAAAFRELFALLVKNEALCANAPEAKRAKTGYDRLLAVTALALLADAVNRFCPGTAADISGVVMFMAKIVMYVMFVAAALGVNKLRVSFNTAHPLDK